MKQFQCRFWRRIECPIEQTAGIIIQAETKEEAEAKAEVMLEKESPVGHGNALAWELMELLGGEGETQDSFVSQVEEVKHARQDGMRVQIFRAVNALVAAEKLAEDEHEVADQQTMPEKSRRAFLLSVRDFLSQAASAAEDPAFEQSANELRQALRRAERLLKEWSPERTDPLPWYIEPCYQRWIRVQLKAQVEEGQAT